MLSGSNTVGNGGKGGNDITQVHTGSSQINPCNLRNQKVSSLLLVEYWKKLFETIEN